MRLQPQVKNNFGLLQYNPLEDIEQYERWTLNMDIFWVFFQCCVFFLLFLFLYNKIDPLKG